MLVPLKLWHLDILRNEDILTNTHGSSYDAVTSKFMYYDAVTSQFMYCEKVCKTRGTYCHPAEFIFAGLKIFLCIYCRWRQVMPRFAANMVKPLCLFVWDGGFVPLGNFSHVWIKPPYKTFYRLF